MSTTTETPTPPAKKATRTNWRKQYEDLQVEHEACAERIELCADLTSAVETWHDEAQHSGAFRHCDHPVCDAANDVLYQQTGE